MRAGDSQISKMLSENLCGNNRIGSSVLLGTFVFYSEFWYMSFFNPPSVFRLGYQNLRLSPPTIR
ncbi:hypothetical protein OpiT1DRAFT_00592 [Opitutaceae bacterium TAV1]|nr:hypothetical protein OpiT1DRAFT_00592 [Opitutaceae bacterium TAV1]